MEPVELTFSRLWVFPIFFLLVAVFRINAVVAGICAVLVPSTRLRLSWRSAVCLALVTTALKTAQDNHLAGMAGCFFRDMISSRTGTAIYRLFGDVVSFADEASPLPPIPTASPGKVQVVRTARDSGERMATLPPLALTDAGVGASGIGGSQPMGGTPLVQLDAGVRFQKFIGFGGSFTESSADLLLKMSAEKQKQIISAYFDEKTGLGYRLGRLHMGSCDFSRGNWSCAEKPGDVELESFTIERYHKAILPMLRRAQAATSAALKLVASPWSPPRWMKDTGSMLTGGKLRAEYRETWAKHYVLFAEAFKAAGVPLWAFTVQNEPQAQTPWENCLYTHEEERDFVRDHLGPALAKSSVDVKLMIWDHNRDDMFARAKAVYSDPVAEKYVWGVAYHWYGDPRYEMWPAREGQVLFDNLRHVHELRPDKHIIMSESCQEFGPRITDWTVAERYGEAIIRDLNNWLEGWIDWNLILDESGGPNHVQNLVSAPVLADVRRDRVMLLSPYFYIGHFSRFIQEGAERILVATNRDGLEATAFANPDGSIVAVVLNRGDHGITFQLRSGGKVAEAEAPAHSISTFTLDGAV